MSTVMRAMLATVTSSTPALVSNSRSLRPVCCDTRQPTQRMPLPQASASEPSVL